MTNSGYIDSGSLDGVRLALAADFHDVYVFNLRGNQREGDWRREGGKIFDAGSQAGVAIMLLVRKPGGVGDGGGRVHYLDIGDSLSRTDKLKVLIEALPAPDGFPPRLGDLPWVSIAPNAAGDWINQRSESFRTHTPLQDDSGASIFALRALGLASGRDAWNYNSSRPALDTNVSRMIEAYNAAVDAYAAAGPATTGSLTARTKAAADLVEKDPTRFSWNDKAFTHVARGVRYGDGDRDVRVAIYRPFHRRLVEAGQQLNARASLVTRILPNDQTDNVVITVATTGSRSPFATLAVTNVPDLHVWPDGTVCFPLRVVGGDAGEGDTAPSLLADAADTWGWQHNVTDHALAEYHALDAAIGKDDVFYYVYGILHSPDFRAEFAADLKKAPPRIPRVSTAQDFWAFSAAGRDLAQLHTGYETVDPWPALAHTFATGFDVSHPDAYRVLSMKHPKVADPNNPNGPKVEDRSRIVYNDWITIESIPERAYAYELGPRSAIGWVMESNRVRTDKASGIRNDPNDWAIEHGNPRYILDLVGRVVTVSMRTLDIVESLPRLGL